MLGIIQNIGIEALTSTVSKSRISIAERCENLILSNKVERLTRGTGIKALSIVEPSVCTSDLCVEAAKRIFSTGIDREDIGAVVFISQTADYLTPATSYYIQNRLGLPTDILAFDINLGCSGFVYGIHVAASLLSNIDNKVLLCCGDTSSRNAFPKDTSMMSIAADAGSVAIISKYASDKNKKIFYNIESFGDRADLLLVARGGARKPKIIEGEDVNLLKENYCNMDGMGVMNFSLKEVPENIERLLQYAKIEKNEIDMAVLHQANGLIVKTLADKLHIPREKVPFKSAYIGNTSSASIPVCLSELAKDGEYKLYQNVLLSGFGVGMSVASMMIDFSDMTVLETGEI
jgi:3-oxoacyl-[acyl-carrier-protein] synthase III